VLDDAVPLAPLCIRCVGYTGEMSSPGPCIVCSRPTRHLYYYRGDKALKKLRGFYADDRFVPTSSEASFRALHGIYNLFCSEACREIAKARRVRRKAAQRRREQMLGAETACACCGQLFRARRVDAITCSSACRQKLYRRRVTDNRMCKMHIG
jgi:hypothetical protein